MVVASWAIWISQEDLSVPSYYIISFGFSHLIWLLTTHISRESLITYFILFLCSLFLFFFLWLFHSLSYPSPSQITSKKYLHHIKLFKTTKREKKKIKNLSIESYCDTHTPNKQKHYIPIKHNVFRPHYHKWIHLYFPSGISASLPVTSGLQPKFSVY